MSKTSLQSSPTSCLHEADQLLTSLPNNYSYSFASVTQIHCTLLLFFFILFYFLTLPEKQRRYFVNKGLSSQGYGFSNGHVWMWELDYKAERRRIDAFELWCWRSLLIVPWTARSSKPVHPKGDQSWVFIGRTDVEAETPILWPPDANSWLIWKDPGARKNWGQEE